MPAEDVRAQEPDGTAAAAGGGLPWLLRGAILTAFVLPADMIVAPLGATGYVSMILALLLFATWLGAGLLGLYDIVSGRHPIRVALAILWLGTIAAYVTMPLYGLTVVQRASADRWLIALVGISGLILVTGECVRSLERAHEVVSTITLGASICALIALYQSATFTDPLDLVRSLMIGMTQNGGNTTFQLREGFVRVAGTTFTPIELGVVSAMVLPVAVWHSLFARRGPRWWHWAQSLLVAVAAVLTVSRSAVLGLAVGAAVAIPFLPRTARRWALMFLPVGVVAVFLLMPGFVSTLSNAFTAGTSDPSLSTRVNNFPRVEAMVNRYPWTGQGPATYIPVNALEILDNQYLHSAVEMGLIGAVAVLLFFLIPVVAALQGAVSTSEPELRSLGGCVAASGAIALVGSATFDAFSFPVFMIILPVIAGLAGAVWKLAQCSPGVDHLSVVVLKEKV